MSPPSSSLRSITRERSGRALRFPEQGGPLSRLGGLSTAATRSLGTPQWEAVLRGTGVVLLLAIYPAMQWPEVGALAAYLCITVFVNGPLAPLLPAVYEPIQIIMGRGYSPVVVAVIGCGGTCCIEVI